VARGRLRLPVRHPSGRRARRGRREQGANPRRGRPADGPDTGGKRSRVNIEALVAAKLFGGLSLGVGFTTRFDSQPLPGKERVDTSSQATLIYTYAAPRTTVATTE